jgi:anaerobic magnesium-protoporphyrin IX monomethyl ester cyclase
MRLRNEPVLLVNPCFDLRRHYGGLARAGPTLLPVGPAYLAAVLEQHRRPVTIWDGQVHPGGLDGLAELLRAELPSVVGITCFTPMVPQTHAVAELVRNMLPDSAVVVGGTHPTVLPAETLEDANIDYVVRGEGEHTLPELLKAWERRTTLGNVLGISYRQDGTVVHTPDRPYEEDLDSLPLPARHLLPLDAYRQVPDAAIARPIQAMITSRGCPHRCIFCSARLSSGYRYRAHSPARVLEEMQLLIEEHGARQIIFLDDNLVVDRDRVREICERILERGYERRAVWTCAARADQVDEPLLHSMRRAGCRLISFGVETGSPRLMRLIKKGITLEQIRRAVAAARQAGIFVRGTFILGLPTETAEESRQTIAFAKELRIDSAKFSLATPYPGTELYAMAVAEGLPPITDWGRLSSMAGFSTYEPAYVPLGRQASELKALQRKAMREFYLRPRQLFAMLGRTRTVSDLALYWEAGKSLLKRDRR